MEVGWGRHHQSEEFSSWSFPEGSKEDDACLICGFLHELIAHVQYVPWVESG